MNIELLRIILLIVQLLFILRFHLELSKINGFIEPINTIRKITNPFVLPIKRLLPAGWAKTFAAIIVAFSCSLVLIVLFTNDSLANSPLIALVTLLFAWITFLKYGMFLYVIGSWIQIPSLQRANYILSKLFEPMLNPIRRLLPSMAGFDFSPLVFLLALMLAGDLLPRLIY